jgi:hypothetical protein
MDTFNLSHLAENDVRTAGHQLLYSNQTKFQSFEEIAQYCTNSFYNALLGADSRPAFALIRIFRATRREDLPPELQAQVTTPYALALMGTSGLEPDWNDRTRSVRRKAIPIDQHMSPMFQGVFHALGFSWEGFAHDAVPKGEDDSTITRLFHVGDVATSSYITDQSTFVQPYGIKSVLAIGSPFLGGAAYVLIAFSLITISQEVAHKLSTLAPYLSTLLAGYNQRGVLWKQG